MAYVAIGPFLRHMISKIDDTYEGLSKLDYEMANGKLWLINNALKDQYSGNFKDPDYDFGPDNRRFHQHNYRLSVTLDKTRVIETCSCDKELLHGIQIENAPDIIMQQVIGRRLGDVIEIDPFLMEFWDENAEITEIRCFSMKPYIMFKPKGIAHRIYVDAEAAVESTSSW